MRRRQVKTHSGLLTILYYLNLRIDANRKADIASPFPTYETAITNLLADYRRAFDRGKTAGLERKEAIEERDEAAAQLELTIRHFWTVVELRTIRLKHAAHTPNLYYPKGRKQRPNDGKPSIWIALGKLVVAGEAKAQKMGLPAMSNPASTDISPLIDAVTQAESRVQQATESAALLQPELERLQHKARTLVNEVATVMTLHLKSYSPAKQRRIMRSYGYRFTRDKKQRLPKTLR